MLALKTQESANKIGRAFYTTPLRFEERQVLPRPDLTLTWLGNFRGKTRPLYPL